MNIDKRGGRGRPAARDRMKTPWWFKVWAGFCGVVGISLVGVLIWAIITLVQWVTSR